MYHQYINKNSITFSVYKTVENSDIKFSYHRVWKLEVQYLMEEGTP